MRPAEPKRVTYSRPLSELVFSPWIMIPMALVLGGFIAFQSYHLTPRYMKLIFGLLFFLGATRLPFHLAMAMFLIMWPAPTYIFLTDTNILFLGVFLIIWMTRVRLGSLPSRVKTPIDWAILVYLGVHVLSFINIETASVLSKAGQAMAFMTAGVVFYLLLVNAFRTEKHLEIALNALCICSLFVSATAIAEYFFGYSLVPTWFLFSPGMWGVVAEGDRAGGVFGFHGLLADFSAMNFYLQIVLGMRTRRRLAKFWYYSLAVLGLLNIGYSANRGGVFIWVLGGIYFLWFHRKKVSWPKIILGLAGAFAGLEVLGLTSEKMLNRVRIFERLATTSFQRGIPDDRVQVWSYMFRRIPEHPWIGHGPYIEFRRGATGELFWPHNAYLFYLYTTGVAGLLTFLWILVKTIILSFPRGPVDFARGPLVRAAQALFHIQVVMFAFGQLRDEHQRGNVYIYYMWLLIAFAVITTRLARAQSAPARVDSNPYLT